MAEGIRVFWAGSNSVGSYYMALVDDGTWFLDEAESSYVLCQPNVFPPEPRQEVFLSDLSLKVQKMIANIAEMGT